MDLGSALDEAREWRGHWWLPGQEDGLTPGVLKYVPGEGLDLSLIGGFEFRITHVNDKNEIVVDGTVEKFDTILGQCGNQRLTLVECFHVNSSNHGWSFGDKPQEQSLKVQQALVGEHVADPTGAVFSQCCVSIEDLTIWSASSMFAGEMKFSSENVPVQSAFTSTVVEEDPIARIPANAMNIRLARMWTDPHFEQQRGQTIARMRETAFLSLEPDDLWTFEALMEEVSATRDLIQLAANRACAVLWVSLSIASGEGENQVSSQVGLYYASQLQGDSAAKGVDVSEVLFTCQHVPFDVILPRWYELRSKCKAAATLVLGLRYAKHGFVQTQLLTAAGAAEVMHRNLGIDSPPIPPGEYKEMRKDLLASVPTEHRSWVSVKVKNEPDLRQRLRDLASLPDSEAVGGLIPDVEHWAKVTVQARNDMTHEGQHPRQKIVEIVAIVRVTTAVVLLNLLQELSIPAGRQREILSSNPTFRSAADSARRWLTPEPVASTPGS